MIKKSWLYFSVPGFVFGIVANELFGSSSIRFGFLFFGLLIVFASVFYQKSRVAALLMLAGFSFIFGFLRSDVAITYGTRSVELDRYIDEQVSFVGLISEEQEKRDFNTRIYFQPEELNETKYAGKTAILLTTTNPRDFYYGDRIRVEGKLIKPENFFTDTGRIFDYVGYLQAKDIRFLIRNAQVEFLEHDPSSKILSALFWTKRQFVNSISNMLPEPQASLAAGILIDGKQSINGELQEKFRKTGLVHIVVLSGYNVSIIAEAISRAFMFLPRTLGLLSSVVGIVAFALVTGASATVVRASVMAIIVIVSKLSLRNYDPCRGLFLASLFMLVHNPGILLHSPSFQLSFMATFAVVRIAPVVERRAGFITERLGLRSLVVSNLVVQLYLLPMLSWMTGFLSVVSLPVNILVLPLIPITMLMSFLTAVTGLLGRIFGLPFAFASQLLLTYELKVVDFFSGLSFAEFSFGVFSGYAVACFYVVSISLVLARGWGTRVGQNSGRSG